MKFIVSSSYLLKQLQVLGSVINSSNTLPILDNFLFELSKNTLTVSASDLETTMSATLEINSKDQGSMTVPAKLLLDILKTFPEQPLTLAKAREQFNAFDHNRDGKLDTAELDELAGNAPATGAPQSRGEEPPAREEMKKGGGGERGGKGQAFVALPDQPRSSDGKFMLKSPVVEDLQALPVEFTGDGDGISPPLQWTGAPADTKGYALIMDHVTPDGDRKWYWTLYDIPGSASSLPKNVTHIGKLGTGFKGEIGYEPPMSKGPGAKTYVITLYALSEPERRWQTRPRRAHHRDEGQSAREFLAARSSQQRWCCRTGQTSRTSLTEDRRSTTTATRRPSYANPVFPSKKDRTLSSP